jgi:hypothetical protein
MPALAPTHATALASPLHQFAGWHLLVNCPGCRMLRTVQIDALIERQGGAITVGQVVARLRCRTCDTTPDWVQLADGLRGRTREVREVTLLVQSPRTMIRIGRCSTCRQTSRRDYTERRTVQRRAAGGETYDATEFYRTIGDGRTVLPGEDLTCPRCGAFTWLHRIVEGFRTDAVCDHRCTGARSFKCECSCGGENHGRKYLIASAVTA